jgi:hypothetical protein
LRYTVWHPDTLLESVSGERVTDGINVCDSRSL